MQTRTKLFIALIVAMVVLLGFAWYTWPEQTAPTQTLGTVPTSVASSTATSTTPATSTSTTAPASLYAYPSLGEGQGIITLGGQTIYADLAENPAQQELGLGNRASLGAHQGMLFLFPNDDVHMFWMKDMSFSIDMIWMADDGTVIYIQPNVAPSTYPSAFGPSSVSRYVLEVPANFAANNDITVGDKATLP